jgi:dsDNA-binding SOS-regulon protein
MEPMKFTIVRRYDEDTMFDFADKITDALTAAAIWLEDDSLKVCEIWNDDILILDYDREKE